MKVEIDALCQKGLVRDNNEDALSVGGIILRDNVTNFTVDISEDGFFYLLVSDGMGGHEDGEEASEFTLNELKEKFEQKQIGAKSFEDDMRKMTNTISTQLNQMAAEKGQQLPMGCTLTGIVWHYGKIWLVNAGDSRTYRYRNGMLRQLTIDETERGITGDPNAEIYLLNCIGAGQEGRLTIIDMEGKLLEDDILLICSDGLTDMVTDEQLEEALEEGNTAADLYRLACEGGGVDNVSVILARIKSGSSS
jgi:protein phosphatase